MEVAIAEIFAESLRLSDGTAGLGADDDFFALGGDSIVSTTMVNGPAAAASDSVPATFPITGTIAGIAAVAHVLDTDDQPGPGNRSDRGNRSDTAATHRADRSPPRSSP